MRFIDLGIIDPGSSIAYDRTLFEARALGLTPDTLCLYTRDRRTVSLGRSRNMEDDVLSSCAHDVTVIKRMSGGGSILTGPGQINYTLVIGDRIPSRSESFKIICGALMKTLSELGIDTTYKPPNDILASGKKISGSAQYRNSDCIMQHGTLILKSDPLIYEILKQKKNPGYDGLTSVNDILGMVPERVDIANAFMSGFSERFETEMECGTLTEWEGRRADTLREGFRDGVSDP